VAFAVGPVTTERVVHTTDPEFTSRGQFRSAGVAIVVVRRNTRSTDTTHADALMIRISSMSATTAICIAVTTETFTISGSSHGTAVS